MIGRSSQVTGVQFTQREKIREGHMKEKVLLWEGNDWSDEICILKYMYVKLNDNERLKPALGNLLMKCPCTGRSRSDVCSNDTKNDPCVMQNSTEALIQLIQDYDVLPMAPLVPNLAKNYLEPLPVFLARLWAVPVETANGRDHVAERGKRPLLDVQDVDMPRQGCR